MSTIDYYTCTLTLTVVLVPLVAGYFWQITDIHYDANYSQHGLAHYLCHQQPWNLESHAADRETETKKHYGPYGDYDCDSPWALVKSAVTTMKELAPDVDFILWTGYAL